MLLLHSLPLLQDSKGSEEEDSDSSDGPQNFGIRVLIDADSTDSNFWFSFTATLLTTSNSMTSQSHLLQHPHLTETWFAADFGSVLSVVWFLMTPYFLARHLVKDWACVFRGTWGKQWEHQRDQPFTWRTLGIGKVKRRGGRVFLNSWATWLPRFDCKLLRMKSKNIKIENA